MEQNKELQNNDFILPGNLGTIQVGNKVRDIKSVYKKKDGSVTITVGETKPEPLIIDNVKIKGIGIYYPEQQIQLPNAQPKE